MSTLDTFEWARGRYGAKEAMSGYLNALVGVGRVKVVVVVDEAESGNGNGILSRGDVCILSEVCRSRPRPFEELEWCE